MNEEMKPYLAATYFFNADDLSLQAFVDELQIPENSSPLEKAILLYYEVRDRFLYDPFNIRIEGENLRATQLLKDGRGHCIDKAAFFISACRSIGVPARLGLAKVKNHMGTAKLEKLIGSDVLVPHGYAEVYLNGKWLKCTPAFNRSLCEKLGVAPLEFNGEEDSVFQAFDREEGGFMEYLEDYGSFDDLPLEFIITLLQKNYPHLFDEAGAFLLSGGTLPR